LGR
ncbi:putative membrane protein, partial [Vibrio parahaemolyticus V-223/04]|jgi:hypothetical protein